MGINVFLPFIPLCFAPTTACVASVPMPDASIMNEQAAPPDSPACTGNSTVAVAAADVMETLRWGGLIMLRKEMDHEEHSPVLLTVANDEWIHFRIPRYPMKKPCTLQAERCVWVFRALQWKPPADKFRTTPKDTIVSVVLRPDGPKLENADVRVYVDGCHRIYAMSAWKPPYNSDNTRLMTDINWEEGIPVACQKFKPPEDK
jgi:hypothetical protein